MSIKYPNQIQIFSRNNDTNGQPYRLILVIGNNGYLKRAIESRSSMPNIFHKADFRFPRATQPLGVIHLAPKEYKELKRDIIEFHKIKIESEDY